MAKTTTQDDLAEVIAGGLNKFFKDATVAYVGDDSTPTDLTDFTTTGCTTLDLAISNRPHGGIAYGRIVEISGLEGAGKSLVAAHMMAGVQKAGGVAVLIDTETAVNWEFFDAVGIDRTKNWVYTSLDTVEDIFDSIENIIETVRRSSKDKPVIIVVDSIAGASTKAEMATTFDKQGYATGKAIIISQAMRKITSTIGKHKIALVLTNQLRQKMNAPAFSDPWVTSGGKAIAFHSSVRLRLSLVGKISKGEGKDKVIIGVKIKASVTKNRLGPPHRAAEFDIYFDRGIDDEGSMLQYLRDKDVITGKSNALSYNNHKFNVKEWHNLLKDEKLKEELYLKMCELCIMSYSSVGVDRNELDLDQEVEE